MYGKFTGLQNQENIKIYEYDKVKLEDGKTGVVVYKKRPDKEYVRPFVLLDRAYWVNSKPTYVPITNKMNLKVFTKLTEYEEMGNYRFARNFDYNTNAEAAN
jgi:hypothetical protein